MRKYIFAVMLIGIGFYVDAQSNTFPNTGAAGIGTATPDASSLLEIKSTKKGVLVPRMTLNQRNAIVSPATGLLIFQTNDQNGFYYYDGASWEAIAPNSTKTWKKNRSAVYYSTGNVGIGTSTPAYTLDVSGDINQNPGSVMRVGGVPMLKYDDYPYYNLWIGNANSSGYYNTAIGVGTLFSNTGGTSNTAFGNDALYHNTSGHVNTAIGASALYSNTTGYENTAIGTSACGYNFTGLYNTAVGRFALFLTTASDYNTAVGYNAGGTHDNGYNNVFIGANVDVNGAGYYNDIAIGQGTICTDVSQARFGNSATVSIGGYANWSNISDGRVKKNIKQNVPGLSFINKLQPITYNLDLDAADKIIQYQRKDTAGRIIPLTQVEQTGRTAKEKILYTGFVAQDVEKAAKSLNYDFSGVDAAKNSKDVYGLRYAEFVVPLVKAVQELSRMNDDKNAKIDSLQKQTVQQAQINNDLEARLAKLEALMNINKSTVNDQASIMINSSAALQQNVPNPFSNSTTISYSIPQKYSSAKIIITDKNGVALKQFNLSSAKGSVTINAATLLSGAYQYALYIDGRMIDSKQMLLTK